jgi:nitrite reductase/ring-hydroxylating ferredoxin subunit
MMSERSQPSEIYTVSAKHKGPFHVGGVRLFVLHRNNETYLARDYCSHRGGPLSLGTCMKERDTIVCPWHGYHNRMKTLVDTALPSVRVGDTISFLLTQVET